MSETLRDACRASLDAAGKTYHYYSLAVLAKIYPALEKLPYSLKVLLENLLRNEDGGSVTEADIEALANWADNCQKGEIAFRPSRILLQDSPAFLLLLIWRRCVMQCRQLAVTLKRSIHYHRLIW